MGKEFDDKIYESIVASCFFTSIYHYVYLHVDNIWCARELYHAIEVEKVIRKHINNKDYCYILPIIQRCSPSDLPKCICRKTAQNIRELEYFITSNKPSPKLFEFQISIHDTLYESWKLIDEEKINLVELCKDIPIPTDKTIIKWIKEQKKAIKKSESENLPILKKSA